MTSMNITYVQQLPSFSKSLHAWNFHFQIISGITVAAGATKFGILWPCCKGHLGPFRPKMAKRVRNELPGSLGTEGPKMGRRDPSPNLIRGARKFPVEKQQKESITWCGGLFCFPGPRSPTSPNDFSALENLGENFSTLNYITWWIFLSHKSPKPSRE